MNKEALVKDLNEVYNLVSNNDITEAMERLEFVINEVKLLSIPDVVSQRRELLRFIEIITDIADLELYHWTNEEVLEYCIKKLKNEHYERKNN